MTVPNGASRRTGSALSSLTTTTTRTSTTVLAVVCMSAASFLLGTRLSSTDTTLYGSSLVTTTSSSSASSTTTGAMGAAGNVVKTHQILVYGDSLTSGVSGTRLYPYSKYLEQALLHPQAIDEEETSDTPLSPPLPVRVKVHTLGLPGWTTAGMLKGLDGAKAGLRTAIKSYQTDNNPTTKPLSLVILLAGTNDLKKPNPKADDMVKNLLQLHGVIRDLNVPHSISIGVPRSKMTAENAKLSAVVTAVNEKLQQTLDDESETAPYPTTTFVPFPVEYAKDSGSTNWHDDGVHLTEQGYQLLGQSLAPLVAQILDAIDNPDEER